MLSTDIKIYDKFNLNSYLSNIPDILQEACIQIDIWSFHFFFF